jgi:GNAT superfamily N-acetyltransferase
VSNSSVLPGEDAGFGGGIDSPFQDASMLAALWRDPNVVGEGEVLVAEMDGRIVGCVTVEERGGELELVNIAVPLQLQGRGIGTILVRSVEERARAEGKQAVTAGTSRNAEGVAWKSLPWWQHLGYLVTHEEENEWTRSIGPGVREIRAGHAAQLQLVLVPDVRVRAAAVQRHRPAGGAELSELRDGAAEPHLARRGVHADQADRDEAALVLAVVDHQMGDGTSARVID